MELLSRIILATGSGLSDLFPVVTCRLVRMSIEHGNIPESANGYIFYGQLMSRDHDLARAYHFGKLALDIAHRFEDGAMLSQAYLYVGYQLIHWKLDFRRARADARDRARVRAPGGGVPSTPPAARPRSVLRGSGPART